MTIDKAIEGLEARVEYGKKNYPQMDTTDVQLGIEALKRVKEARKKVYFTARSLLPGETKD